MIRVFLAPAGRHILWLAAVNLLFLGCQAAVNVSTTPASVSGGMAISSRTPVSGDASTSTPSVRTGLSPASLTPIPTATHSPTPLPTATPIPTSTLEPTLTATPIGPCDQRIPSDSLLVLVTLEYGLSRDFEPTDLVPLSDYFSNAVTLGYPTEIRQVAIDPLVEMIDAMQSAGLQPTIISGYRSYASQAIAWNKWLAREGDRAQIISAPPGFSEHQLGTTVDFGSPDLPEIVGEEDIEFHTYFYMTAEGVWLAENAHKYGFTLSYPREAIELTGFYYEPWHYRYVGIEMATDLKEQGLFLAQYQLETQPIPCIP